MKFVRKFLKDEAGLALSEYLILFSLLSVLVIGAITYFGAGLGRQFANWGDMFAPGAQVAVAIETSPGAGSGGTTGDGSTGGGTTGGTGTGSTGGDTTGSTGGGTTTGTGQGSGTGNGNGNGKNK